MLHCVAMWRIVLLVSDTCGNYNFAGCRKESSKSRNPTATKTATKLKRFIKGEKPSFGQSAYLIGLRSSRR